MTDTWLRRQKSEPKIQIHVKVSLETEGKRHREKGVEGGCSGNTGTVGRVEDEQTSKMTERQRRETEKNIN